MSEAAPPIIHLRHWHFAALAAWLALGVWLAVIGPDVLCDFGSGRSARSLEFVLCSPSLLVQGPSGIALFAWMWSGPVAMAVLLIRLNRKRRA